MLASLTKGVADVSSGLKIGWEILQRWDDWGVELRNEWEQKSPVSCHIRCCREKEQLSHPKKS